MNEGEEFGGLLPGRVPAGWFPDPRDGSRLRYWDGGRWTDAVAPLPPAPAAPAATMTFATPAPAMVTFATPMVVAGEEPSRSRRW